MGRAAVPLTFMAFDLLRVEGRDVMRLPYAERRALLEQLNLNGRSWRTPEAFEDGDALWDAIREHELEGVVAKRLASSPSADQAGTSPASGAGSRRRTDYWRYEMEREGALKSRTRALV